MENMAFTFDNTIELTLRSGQTGEILAQHEQHNDISDEMLAMDSYIYLSDRRNQSNPYCFILRDGPAWSGFTWDRKNPWAPYAATQNNIYGGSYDATADPHWSANTWAFVGNRHKLFYRWTKLADDFSLKALGICGWDYQLPNYPQCCGIVTGQAGTFIPNSLIILPTPITIKGRKGGSQVPDILEISYYLSAVGVN